MSTRINTNIEALNAQRNLGVTASKYATSVERLSSGLRINRAADDAAGLAISEKLRAQVTGLNQAQRNAQDGVSMVQTAEGALAETHSMLQRIRELAVQAANATIGQSDAASVNAEITALQAEINRISNTTKFNGQSLLTGALSVSQSGGTVAAGYVVAAGTGTAVSGVTVAGGKAATTYTLSSSGGAGTLTLSETTGGITTSQTLTVSVMAARSSQTLNFSTLGVAITVSSVAGESAANVAAGLAAGPATPPTIGIGGAAGTDVVNGDVIRQTDGAAVLVQNVMFYPSGAIDAPQPTAVASPGVAAGMITFSVTALGHMTGTLGGESFAGDLAAFQPNHSDTIVLTGTRGNTITLTYHQHSTAGSLADEATDFTGSRVTFVAGAGTAAVSALAAAPAATAGTYTFTSAGAGSLTLGGNTVAVTDMGANEVRTMTFGNISFTLTADGAGMSAASIVNNFLQPANDTIVVTSTGGAAGTPGTLTTGAGSSAMFQVGANQGDILTVAFSDARTSAYTGFDAAITAFTNAAGTSGWALAAGALITATDTAIGSVSSIRADFGAVENRLQHTVASIRVASESLNASNSRIKDLDVAAEMVMFTKNSILQQAGTSILAQANSAPQNILALLR